MLHERGKEFYIEIAAFVYAKEALSNRRRDPTNLEKVEK